MTRAQMQKHRARLGFCRAQTEGAGDWCRARLGFSMTHEHATAGKAVPSFAGELDGWCRGLQQCRAANRWSCSLGCATCGR